MITITNNNIYRSDVSVSDLLSLEKARIIDAEEIINYLSEDVELGESVTFKRLFDIVSLNVDKFNEIFYSTLGGYDLKIYLKEMGKKPDGLSNVDYLEVYWGCDKYDDDLTIYASFHGIKGDEYYAMDFVPLNDMKNYNIKLNKRVEVINYNESEKEKIRSFIGNKSFTLFDLCVALFNEITFFGDPTNKKKVLAELEESISDIEEKLDDDSDEFVSFDDMIKDFESDDKYLVKYKELMERVDSKRMSKEKNLDNLKACLLEKLKIFDIIENSDENLSQYYKKLTDIEYNMQMLYGEDEDISYHKFWKTPKCICPKIDNEETFPSETPFFDKNCPIHKKPL